LIASKEDEIIQVLKIWFVPRRDEKKVEIIYSLNFCPKKKERMRRRKKQNWKM